MTLYYTCLSIRYGPLRLHWTMRFEAKHSYLKRLQKSLGNFINVCHTLATRHEQLQCYHRLDREFLGEMNVIYGPGIYILHILQVLHLWIQCVYAVTFLYVIVEPTCIITGETVPRSMVPSLDPSTSSVHEQFLR